MFSAVILNSLSNFSKQICITMSFEIQLCLQCVTLIEQSDIWNIHTYKQIDRFVFDDELYSICNDRIMQRTKLP